MPPNETLPPHPLPTPTGECTEKLNVVMLYDRVTSVDRAMAAYSHLKRELENELRSELRIWRIDVSTYPECAAQADAEIEAADVIIVAAQASQSVPAALSRWTEGAGESRSLLKRALIAVIEAADEPIRPAGIWNWILGSAAAQIEPNVFFWSDSADPNETHPGAPATARRSEFGAAVSAN